MTAPEITIPDRLNMAQWFLDARLDEGLGDKTAIYYHGSDTPGDGPRELSYAGLVAESCRVTNLLRELGLGIEDRVLILMTDSPAWAAAYFGILRAGCVAVPANAWLEAKDYAYYLEYARPKAVIVDAEIWSKVDEARRTEGRHTRHFIVHDRSGATTPAGTVDFNRACAALPTTAETEPT
ncbi:MAG: AMP-binding protein, partial [Myxococcales bacterium]|nr:AMP-binding protein [Myxococcales bacterium]